MTFVEQDVDRPATADGVIIQPKMLLYKVGWLRAKDCPGFDEMVVVEGLFYVEYVGASQVCDKDGRFWTQYNLYWCAGAANRRCRRFNERLEKERSRLLRNTKARERRAAKKQESAP